MAHENRHKKRDRQRDLANRYRDPLIAFFLRRTSDRAEAEDFAQETLLRIVQRGGLSGIENPDGFIFRTAQNLLNSQGRRAGVREKYQSAVEASITDVEALTPERVIQGRQDLARVFNALDELAETTRDMFVLHRLEGMKHKEIAELYGVSTSAVEKRIMKAIAHLMFTVEK